MSETDTLNHRPDPGGFLRSPEETSHTILGLLQRSISSEEM